MIKLGFSRDSGGRLGAPLAAWLLLFAFGFSAVYGASGEGFRIFTLKHISPKQGRDYLLQMGIGPASELSGSPSLLVTGKAEDVARAMVMLDLVDAPQEFAVKMMGASLKAEILPSSEAISEKAAGVSVGTFSAPPKESGGAIVDVHNGSLVIIAQASRIDRVVAAVGKLLQSKKNGVSEPAAGGPEVEPVKETPKPLKTTPEPVMPKIDRTDV
ncbi:MAG: hypothetical protein JXN61_14185, partial [Sedimentisphaerales bacterium]|nr:hypothetical protein [Sedimentisphaerales bacterium]